MEPPLPPPSGEFKRYVEYTSDVTRKGVMDKTWKCY